MADFNWNDHPVVNSNQSSNFNWNDHPVISDEPSLSEKIKSGAKYFGKATVNQLPIIGGMVGGALGTPFDALTGPVGTMAGASLGGVAGQAAKDYLNSYINPKEAPESFSEGMARQAGAGNEQGLAAFGGELTSKALAPISQKLGQYLGSKAEQFATNATGATGKQVSEFEPTAGRELLNRGLVKFGDSPSNIGSRVSAASNKTGQDIGNTLKELDAQGVTASADNVVSDLQNKISLLKLDPSQAPVVRKLQSMIDDIVETGRSSVPISEGEITKRGYRKAAGNWMDPDAGAAGKEAYLSYMNEVENAANKANPELANKFIKDKETYGLLAPIKEATERRAATLQQTPLGGLGDISAATAGAVAGGPFGAIPAVVAKKVIFPRISSSSAVTSNAMANILKDPNIKNQLATAVQSPLSQLSKYLQNKTFSQEQTNEEK